ncbi:MAG TPA: His/Gly/Thr/Pro-type tRNA ligase C-terminal domain-containing protein, partial [Thermoleophilaceae bacterium]
ELGGPATPGVGWAAGVERILLAAEGEEQPEDRVYVAVAEPEAVAAAHRLARRLREQGYRAEVEQAGRSLKGQLKQADRIGAGATVIVGDGFDIKDMATGRQISAEGVKGAVDAVRSVSDGPEGAPSATRKESG